MMLSNLTNRYDVLTDYDPATGGNRWLVVDTAEPDYLDRPPVADLDDPAMAAAVATRLNAASDGVPVSMEQATRAAADAQYRLALDPTALTRPVAYSVTAKGLAALARVGAAVRCDVR